jgi:hypothetical protein
MTILESTRLNQEVLRNNQTNCQEIKKKPVVDPTKIEQENEKIEEAKKLNQEVFKNIQITSHENMIMKSFEKFYETPDNISLFIPIVNSESKISIRLIDHFVTKYSKTHKISYKLKENDVEQSFNVNSSYKQQLKAYQKRHFDPFSRGDRIPYFMDDSCVITTIGQLNFFRWFISKRVFEYILNNHELIENDMNKKNKLDKKKVKKEKKSKKILKTQISACTNISSNSSHYRQSTSPGLMSFSEPKTDKIIVSFSFN